MGDIATLISSLFLSMTARAIVFSDPSRRYAFSTKKESVLIPNANQSLCFEPLWADETKHIKNRKRRERERERERENTVDRITLCIRYCCPCKMPRLSIKIPLGFLESYSPSHSLPPTSFPPSLPPLSPSLSLPPSLSLSLPPSPLSLLLLCQERPLSKPNVLERFRAGRSVIFQALVPPSPFPRSILFFFCFLFDETPAHPHPLLPPQ